MVVKVMVTFGVDTPQATIILPAVLVILVSRCVYACVLVCDGDPICVVVVVVVMVVKVMVTFGVDTPQATIILPSVLVILVSRCVYTCAFWCVMVVLFVLLWWLW